MGKLRILIADDHAMVREGTRKLLEQEGDFEVVAEVADGEEAVKAACEFAPDIAIIDIAMPRMDGIEATKQIKARCPGTAVLILSAYDDDQFVFSLLESGAAGYLLKRAQSRELIASIRAVSEGESVLDPSVIRKVVNRFKPAGARMISPEASIGELTEREMKILKLMTRGLGNKEIAADLGLSIRTIQAHVGQIFDKLKVSSRTEAVVLALKKNLVSLDTPSSVG
ncbi:MAG: response regulator transcription factor [Chloroflexi bacterium]|nr:response regulator transcription factor [Chloroflexota bacterium]